MSARLAEIEDDRGAIAWERPGRLRNMEASGGRSGGCRQSRLSRLCAWRVLRGVARHREGSVMAEQAKNEHTFNKTPSASPSWRFEFRSPQ